MDKVEIIGVCCFYSERSDYAIKWKQEPEYGEKEWISRSGKPSEERKIRLYE